MARTVDAARMSAAHRNSTHPAVTSSRFFLPVLAALLLGVAAVTGFGLLHSQQEAKKGIVERIQTRTELAGRFTTSFLDDLAGHERAVARRVLSAKEPSRASFDLATDALGVQAAVQLDSEGRLLQVAPAKPALIGTEFASKYAHLSAASTGKVAVSNVVPSAARGEPIVAVAVPYETKYGQRVFSGAFKVSESPISAYLKSVLATRGSRVFLVDGNGTVVASNAELQSGKLKSADAALAAYRGQGAASSGTTRDHFATTRPVDGTPWHVVMAIPEKTLFQTVSGAQRWLPWVAWVAFVLVALGCFLMSQRIVRRRRELAELNTHLDVLSQTDELTGLANRRGVVTLVGPIIAGSMRNQREVSALMIDIDHFKQINDTHGHAEGDRVLIEVAQRISEALRAGDVIGRWGGEEFIAVLPETSLDHAREMAERVRTAISHRPIELDDDVITVTASVGYARSFGQTFDSLITDADDALYLAKSAGRDVVMTLPAAAPATS